MDTGLVLGSRLMTATSGESAQETNRRYSPWVIYSLVYVSSATTLFSESELDEILATSRENNARSSISGMLLYKDGNGAAVLRLVDGFRNLDKTESVATPGYCEFLIRR